MKPWDCEDFNYPDIPTMISPEERQYLHWLGKRMWRDTGHIVEIGPWLGGSTACLASGMRARDQPFYNKLHVYDNFLWRDFMSKRAALPLANGDSFQSFFESNLSAFQDILTVHQQTLPDDKIHLDRLAKNINTSEEERVDILQWNTDTPVEILFVDGAKSWTGMKYALDIFLPHLLPGVSIIVLQDYKYWGTYWVPLLVEQLMAYFELVHNLGANTVAFTLTKKIPQSVIDKLQGTENLEISEGLELLESASQRLARLGDGTGALILQACKIRFCLNKGDTIAAIERFRMIESQWPHSYDDQTVERIRDWLEDETDSHYGATARWRRIKMLRFAKQAMARITN